MEGRLNYEQKVLISEQLIQGTNFAKQLRAQLNSDSSAETLEALIQGILDSYEKSLGILKWSEPIKCQPQYVVAATLGATSVPASPLSVNNGSSRDDEFDRGLAAKEQFDSREAFKKRKMLPKWTNQVKISPEAGLEGPQDGYSWRKYGQKDILLAKYPRSYYRCTYRNTQNCQATKQVQKSDHDPTMFEITYRGNHTCIHGGSSTPALTSPKKQELKQANDGNHQADELARFRTGLMVETENLDLGSDVTEMPCPFTFPSSSAGLLYCENYSSSGVAHKGNRGGNFSSPFLSPSTPESSHFSLTPSPMTEFGQISSQRRSESDLTELVSATNSPTNSPIPDWDFSLDDMGFGPDFPFDMAGIFP
ncbi:hypothetical protein SAY87_024824 [Trapa incisa]|uniref:WRKY domain-containing protein n=1 Tax=Trapa incisa TaxID=236973 RepID=A0AAN7GA76_9MYRT|nr:hypothetical protein SAY87_024824 [Trapa incisa]